MLSTFLCTEGSKFSYLQELHENKYSSINHKQWHYVFCWYNNE